MRHIFNIGNRVIHRWVKKGIGRIIDMDDEGLMIKILWNKGEENEVTTIESWESLSFPPLYYPGHNPRSHQ